MNVVTLINKFVVATVLTCGLINAADNSPKMKIGVGQEVGGKLSKSAKNKRRNKVKQMREVVSLEDRKAIEQIWKQSGLMDSYDELSEQDQNDAILIMGIAKKIADGLHYFDAIAQAKMTAHQEQQLIEQRKKEKEEKKAQAKAFEQKNKERKLAQKRVKQQALLQEELCRFNALEFNTQDVELPTTRLARLAQDLERQRIQENLLMAQAENDRDIALGIAQARKRQALLVRAYTQSCRDKSIALNGPLSQSEKDALWQQCVDAQNNS